MLKVVSHYEYWTQAFLHRDNDREVLEYSVAFYPSNAKDVLNIYNGIGLPKP